MGPLEILLARGEKLSVTSYESPRGLGLVWLIVDEAGDAVEAFSSREEAECALLGQRKPASPLTFH